MQTIDVRPVSLMITLFGLLVLGGGPLTDVGAVNVSALDDYEHTGAYYRVNSDTKGNYQHTKQEPGHLSNDAHCIQAPASLQAACGSLNWAPQTRLPNLIGHRSALELSIELNSFMTHYTLEALANDRLECKLAENLKLLICSNLSPVCLDILVAPCRQMCMRTKSSCKSALQRLGLEWPRFLDCRRFPTSTNGTICLGRQPPTIWTQTNMNLNVPEQTTTIAPTSLRTSPPIHILSTSRRPSSKRRRKEKKERHSTTTTTKRPITEETTDITTSFTTTSPALSTSTTQLTLPNAQVSDNNAILQSNLTNPVGDNGILTTTEAPTTTSTQTLPSSTSSPSSDSMLTISHGTTTTSKPSTTMAPAYDSTTTGPNTTFPIDMTARNDSKILTNATFSSAPIPTVLSQDLTQALCQANPDWLIKTKLTDSQLVNAVKKRKFKVRSIRQIFGSSIASNRSATITNQQQQAQNITSPPRSETNGSKPSAVPPSIYLYLSNSTTLIFPGGPNLLTQSMNEPNPMVQSFSPAPSVPTSESETSSTSNNNSSSTPSSRTFLIFGTAGTRVVSHIVMWPGAKSANKDSDLDASSTIVKTYRDFKLRGLGVCQSLQPVTRSVDQSAHAQQDETTISQANDHTAGTTPSKPKPPRTRKRQQHAHNRRT
uniref:Frizzled-7 n=1 Tax=Aceria tosichella TaxID=561515 RepID=A0A6G1SD46_9ACAR